MQSTLMQNFINSKQMLQAILIAIFTLEMRNHMNSELCREEQTWDLTPEAIWTGSVLGFRPSEKKEK